VTLPRIEIDLGKVEHNARTLVARLAQSGINVLGVTKSVLGSPDIASALLYSGVCGLGDSRIDNIERMRSASIQAEMMLIRTPMLSQVDRVVKHADVSFNTELEVIAALSSAAQTLNVMHGIVLMVELGDLREGVMPEDLLKTVEAVLGLPNIKFRGIGTNLACHSGVSPGAANMAALSGLADSIDLKFGPITDIISGGNSANIDWALSGADTGRINHLRLGEAILFGRETLHRQEISGLHQDAITLIAEVIEAKTKPSLPWGDIAQNAFGEMNQVLDNGESARVILAIGRQDTDPEGMRPPEGFRILGASSDHLVLDAVDRRVSVGDEIPFQINYSAFLRAMTSPFVGSRHIASCGEFVDLA